MKQQPGKVKTVMHEFKAGKLKSSSGQKVTNPKQAVAIAMSEAGMKKMRKFNEGGSMSDAEAKKMADTELANQESARKMMEEKKKSSETKRYARGGKVGESKAMAKKEISFMQRKGAPKSMIKHEKEEYGMKSGGKVKKFAAGGRIKGYADGGTLGPLAGRGGAPQAAVTAAQQAMGGKAPNALRQVGGPAQAAQNMQGLPRLQSGQQVVGRKLSPTVYNQAALQYGMGAGKPAQPVLWQQAPLATGRKLSPTVYNQAALDAMARGANVSANQAALSARARLDAMGPRANLDVDPLSPAYASMKEEADRYNQLLAIARGTPGYKKGGAIAMKKGGACMKKGGSIDGIAQRGKTKTQHFAKGGAVSSRADGIATKGKTNCKMR